jgi:hypothetical protein
MVSPEAVGPFIAPCQQEAVTVRSRRHFSSLGNACWHLKGISAFQIFLREVSPSGNAKIGYKTHSTP